MKKILLLSLFLLSVLLQEAMAQTKTVTGRVTDATTGEGMPGVTVQLKGTSTAAPTDVNGGYSITVPSTGGTLVFSFIGYTNQEVAIGTQSTVNVRLATDAKALGEVVVTALGVQREARTVPYATQQVEAADLNITQNINIKDALAGKVAGVQINGQAGSKLGQFGKIRIRGAISLTSDADPLYIVDGVPVEDPNDVDMENVESVNVLKGPNATSLYGQRAEAGVVVITTKKGTGGIAVEIASSTTWDKVGYLPKYQNLYGGGYEQAAFGTFDFSADEYPAEWQVFNGKRYLLWDNNYADESWGPKFDGQDYVPWYAWWPGTAENPNPYYGKTAKYEAQPDNIKNFYETGMTKKNTLSFGGGNERFNARLSYTYLDQQGITPYTDLKKHFITSNFGFNATDKLRVDASIRYTTSIISGDQNDEYGNQTSGSFNSWFAREVDTRILKELKDLKTLEGYSASWNWWGPDYYMLGGGYEKPAFWFNPYTYMDAHEQTRNNDNVTGSFTTAYSFNDNWKLSATAARTATQYRFEEYFPSYMSNSAAPELYNAWINGFGRQELTSSENNFSADLRYQNQFGDFDLNAFVGGNIRKNNFSSFSARMNLGANTGGLIVPDLYIFSNAGIVPVPQTNISEKQVNSLYGNASIGFRDMLYVDASYRRDWSSALPNNNNGYGYPGIGASLIFTELFDGFDALSFGKLRTGWAQVGNDVPAQRINPAYGTGVQPWGGTDFLVYSRTLLVDPNLTPSLNSSFEAGFDLKFINNRIGFSFTYYNEKRNDEIIPISISQTTGYSQFLTNAGSSSRKGVELALDGDIIRAEDNGFNWNLLVNFARNRTTVDELPTGLQAISAPGGSDDWEFVTVIHELGNNWGQLRGIGFATDENGNRILQPNGLFETESNKYFGSVLPDFTGGILNRFSYKGLSLTAAIDFQKGGKFFSLTEQWGYYSGLLEETAGTNDKGNNVRDDVGEGGGVHVTGVDTDGNTVDTYVDAMDYFMQFQANSIAEPFIHNASYIKLRDVNLSYDFSDLFKTGFLKNNLVKGASIGVVGRNLWLISVSDDNKHRWDPSELSNTFGENSQLPGTRSYGVNVRLTF